MSSSRPSAAAQLRAVAENADANAGSSRSENRPTADPGVGMSSSATVPQAESSKGKKKKHRAGKKRRNRRQSFAATADETDNTEMEGERPSLLDSQASHSAARDSFYRLGAAMVGSNTSLDSEALLDHRSSTAGTGRRQSVQTGSHGLPTIQTSYSRSSTKDRARASNAAATGVNRSRLSRVQQAEDSDAEDDHDRTPLLSNSYRNNASTPRGYGGHPVSPGSRGIFGAEFRHRSAASSRSSRVKGLQRNKSFNANNDDYHVNNPPSVPGSPKLGPDMGYDDVMLAGDEASRGRSPERRIAGGDLLIDIDGTNENRGSPSSPNAEMLKRRMTAVLAQDDVCFPQDNMSELGEEDDRHGNDRESVRRKRRRRRWPELEVLENWAIEEKEERTMEGIRARNVSEPLMIGGRLRPKQVAWHRDNDDTPYRFTYFNEEFPNTIHSQTISELLQPNQGFRNLFIPDRPLLEDSSSSESESEDERGQSQANSNGHSNGNAAQKSRSMSLRSPTPSNPSRRSTSRANGSDTMRSPGQTTGQNTPVPAGTPRQAPVKEKRYGPRPVFWLDVINPTDSEMRVLSKAFGIHPLTAEDIMMQEPREKVELFRHYYFVAYRSFEQDSNSEDYLEPVNIYVVVFKEGVLSFHFSQTPHPANVRRRIRQLSDYLFLTTDWISYAIIDDITDAYAPLIQNIEEEVDNIDEEILALHAAQANEEAIKARTKEKGPVDYEKHSDAGDRSSGDIAGHMLRRVGETRKKVMSLYRLLGNKADVIKGFAKRCNEQWEIAPKSEIGLYLGDIQDHIVTMTGNLSHYENLLSRAHSNYLAQINIRMNERAEQTNDVLGKLTVLGTIVLPMNIVTGLWGMNCLVPGQDVDSLTWFWSITGGLLVFGMMCYFIAKKMYGIV